MLNRRANFRKMDKSYKWKYDFFQGSLKLYLDM